MKRTPAAGPLMSFFALSILVGVSLLLGVYLILMTPVIARDGVFYIEQARKLGVDPLGVARRYPPGYPFLLWAGHQALGLFTDHDSALLWAYGSQGMTLLCRTLALVPLYFLGRLLVGARHSFWALVILLLLPHPARYGSDVLREWPYVLFLSLGFWLLYRGVRANDYSPLHAHGSCGLEDNDVCESEVRNPKSAIGTFACAGLVAGLGYLIRPECQQLVIYGVLGLFQLRIADCGLQIRNKRQAARDLRRFGAGLALIAVFAVPAGAYVRMMGTIVPQQLRPEAPGVPPVIVSVGTKTANNDLLEFEVGTGQVLELAIEAFDPQNARLTFSLVGVPVGSRPVYQLHSATLGIQFWTISNDEKESLLATYSRQVWDYDGIAWYAYTEPGAAPGLQPVYRFWSPVEGRHFYTSSASERDALREPSAAGSWQYENVAFYAFGEADRSSDAVPVYRSHSRRGYSWAVRHPNEASSTPENDGSRDLVAWYVQTAGVPPAGAELDGRTLRWRPDRAGEYQVNIIVSNGRLQSCQPVKIRVGGRVSSSRPQGGGRQAEAMMAGGTDKLVCPWASGGFWPTKRAPSNELATSHVLEISAHRVAAASAACRWFAPPPAAKPSALPLPPFYRPCAHGNSRIWDVLNELDGGSRRPVDCGGERTAGANPKSEIRNPKSARAGVANLPRAIHVLFDALDESLAVVFLAPWLLGLYYRLRYEAGQTERVLVIALVFINVGLMLARYAWVAPGSSRRYSLSLVALTIFYVPVGLEVIAGWLHGIMEWRNNGTMGDRPQDSSVPVFQHSYLPSRSGPCFYTLVAVGTVMCLVWLLLPPRASEEGYRVMARWLQANTGPGDAIAVPDARLSFYADHPEPYFARYLDPRKADYVIRIESGGPGQAPETWQQKYSVVLDDRGAGKFLVAYRIVRAQP